VTSLKAARRGGDEEAKETKATAAEIDQAQAAHDQAASGAQTAKSGGAVSEAQMTSVHARVLSDH
jgi:hypothetical protein